MAQDPPGAVYEELLRRLAAQAEEIAELKAWREECAREFTTEKLTAGRAVFTRPGCEATVIIAIDHDGGEITVTGTQGQRTSLFTDADRTGLRCDVDDTTDGFALVQRRQSERGAQAPH